LYPTLEVVPVNPKTEAFLAHNAVPVEFTEEDFRQVAEGNYLVKVIYLPDPANQEVAITGTDEIISTRLEPGADPIQEALRRGSILLVIRMGNMDQEAPNTPPIDAPPPGGHGPHAMPGMMPPGMMPPGLAGLPPIAPGMSPHPMHGPGPMVPYNPFPMGGPHGGMMGPMGPMGPMPPPGALSGKPAPGPGYPTSLPQAPQGGPAPKAPGVPGPMPSGPTPSAPTPPQTRLPAPGAVQPAATPGSPPTTGLPAPPVLHPPAPPVPPAPPSLAIPEGGAR
jgi:hypothetical protein